MSDEQGRYTFEVCVGERRVGRMYRLLREDPRTRIWFCPHCGTYRLVHLLPEFDPETVLPCRKCGKPTELISACDLCGYPKGVGCKKRRTEKNVL